MRERVKNLDEIIAKYKEEHPKKKRDCASYEKSFKRISSYHNLIIFLLANTTQLADAASLLSVTNQDGVAELERAGLFRIQLLPFRHEQVIRFVDNFLSKEPKLV